ncbi:hypothetical protein [Sphaerochaeta sp. PS]|uniref:hypothetical protein n=1 Tax=Sphaerochaeta sp. PS TaxID=3076336 RepID=UPI0028A3EA53|nr:hypothetical protein [Sphaerochaeta sp. PS]MDT4763422.1 hypothetical protein [Sphaerochaeta sp. PS]
MKSVILFYQHAVREFSSIMKLKEILGFKGMHVMVYSIDFEYVNALRFAKKHLVDVIVTPWMYHQANYEKFVPFIKYSRELIIINLHHEQISSKFTEELLIPQSEEAKNNVYHLVWGDFFKLSLLNAGVKSSLIKVTGNMRNDEVFNVQSSRSDFAEKFNLNMSKIWVLFADNRNWVNYWSEAEKAERMVMGISETLLEEHYLLTKNSLEITISELNNLDKGFFKRFEFIYRPHPGIQIKEGLFPKEVRILSERTIYEWLNVVDVNVVWSSTTIFESEVMGIPSIVYEPIEHPDIFKTSGTDSYYKINKISDINENVILLAKQMQEKNKNYQMFYGKIDGKATQRVADAVIDILNNKDEKMYIAKIIPYSKKAVIRAILFNYVTRLLIFLHLFDIVKYPRSAWKQKNDIPYYKENI